MNIVVTDEAADAAWEAYADAQLGAISGGSRTRMRAAIEAALPHLTDAGEPLAEPTGERWRLIMEAGTRTARIMAGMPEFPAELVTEEVGPTDYEVWRDALQMAAQRLSGRADTGDRREMLALAEWFWERLGEVPVRTTEPHEPCENDDCCRRA